MDSILSLLFRLCSFERDGFNPPDISKKTASRLALLAAQNGVAGWLLDRLLSNYPDWPPTSLMRERLLSSAHGALVRNAAMIGVVGRMSSALRAGGVEPILLKGLSLTRGYYPDPAMRSASDIDILILNGDEAKASALLQSDGAQPTRQRVSTLNAIRNHLPPILYRGLLLEIHRNLARHDVGRSAINDIASHLSPAPYGYSVLDPEALFCHLAIHAASHYRRGATQVKYFVDIAMVMNSVADPHRFMTACRSIAPSAKSDIRWAAGMAVNLLPPAKAHEFISAGVNPLKISAANIDGRYRRFALFHIALYAAYVNFLTLFAILRGGFGLLPTIRYVFSGRMARSNSRNK